MIVLFVAAMFAFVLINAATIFGGAYLIYLWLARKRGDRCGRCDYDLSWLTSSRCPECGNHVYRKLGGHGRSVDEPVERSSLLTLGVVLVGCGVVFNISVIRLLWLWIGAG